MTLIEVTMYGFIALGVVSSPILGIVNHSPKMAIYGTAGFLTLGILAYTMLKFAAAMVVSL